MPDLTLLKMKNLENTLNRSEDLFIFYLIIQAEGMLKPFSVSL